MMQSTTKNPRACKPILSSSSTVPTVVRARLAAFLIACTVLLTGWQPAAIAVEEKAQREVALRESSRLVEQKHYKEGYASFKKLADKGCPYSQCLVGLMHKNGIGVKKDPKLAFQYFEQSAKQGFADAQRWLAEMYWKGEGTAVDHNKALEWFEKAARNDVVEAQYKLGHLYRASGADSLKARGQEWLTKAAKTGIKDVEEGAEKIPKIPYNGPSQTYSNGVSNIAQAWGGYSSLARTLSATQPQ